jgi:hypothetical protein
MRSYKHQLSKRRNTLPHSPPTWPFHRSVGSDLASHALEQGLLYHQHYMLLNLAPTIGSSKSAKGKGEARVWVRTISPTVSGRRLSSQWTCCSNAQYVVACFFAPFLLPYAGYRIPILRSDECTCHCHNPPEPKKKAAAKGHQEPVIHVPPLLPKPQLKFKRTIGHANGVVWSPTLRRKFNMRGCWAIPLTREHRRGVNSRLVRALNRSQSCLSILTRQLDQRTITVTESTISHISLISFNPKHRSLLTTRERPLVSTRAQLDALIDKLRKSTEQANRDRPGVPSLPHVQWLCVSHVA